MEDSTNSNSSNLPIEHVLQNVGAPGIPNILKAKNTYRKCFWLLVVLGSLGTLIAHCVTSFKNYLEYKVTVNVDIIYEPMLAFPAVTICNLNPVRYSILDKFHGLDNLLGMEPQRNSVSNASHSVSQSPDITTKQNGTTVGVESTAADIHRNCMQVRCVATSVLK